jgi:hypothetical protein
MRDQERLTGPVVVALPAEIDIGNAEHVGAHLRAASAPGVTAEMGLTVFAPPLVAVSRWRFIKGRRAASQIPSSNRGLLRSNHVRQIAEAHCRASRCPVLAVGR